ncbi:MAG: ACP S-malonyltransferase [Chlamydiota bacterium]|nr:ACP S-malonyltransferase [Chlamydiota bacterium]
MPINTKIAFIFPGQGAQYVGMGQSFFENSSIARETFEEADDLLGRKLSDIVLNGPDDILTHTKNSQTGIFVMSVAALRVLNQNFPELRPSYCAGLSLGEYTALHAAGAISFENCLPLVQHRGQFMNDACENTEGTMAVILGLNAGVVEEIVSDLNMPNDLWVANFNCPGQVVISGTVKGIEAGTLAAKEKGARRVMPLQVHGAFHSGLMKEAEERLKPYVESADIKQGTASLVMNVTGAVESAVDLIKKNLVDQVTHSVRWEQGIRNLIEQEVDLFIEIGCGKTLSGFNKRIGVKVPTISIEEPEDLAKIAEYLE